MVVVEKHPVARRARHASEYLNMVGVLQGEALTAKRRKEIKIKGRDATDGIDSLI